MAWRVYVGENFPDIIFTMVTNPDSQILALNKQGTKSIGIYRN